MNSGITPTSHRSLAGLSVPTLRWEMASCARYFRRQVPGLVMDTMALPYGITPRDPRRLPTLQAGTQGGTRYRNRAVVLARGGPSFAPADRRFDPTHITRIEAAPGEVERWLRGADGQPPLYVSDGNPATVTIPQVQQGFVSRRRLSGARLSVMPAP